MLLPIKEFPNNHHELTLQMTNFFKCSCDSSAAALVAKPQAALPHPGLCVFLWPLGLRLILGHICTLSLPSTTNIIYFSLGCVVPAQ